MRGLRAFLCLCAVGATLAGGAAGAGSAQPAGAAPAAARVHPTLSEQLIKRIALEAAARSEDRHPSLIQHAAGTRAHANRIASGAIIPVYNWCYLIAVRGRFVAKDAMYPSGAKPPRGTVLTLVVDARTGMTMDAGISDQYPDLAKLGPVTTDLR